MDFKDKKQWITVIIFAVMYTFTYLRERKERRERKQ